MVQTSSQSTVNKIEMRLRGKGLVGNAGFESPSYFVICRIHCF